MSNKELDSDQSALESFDAMRRALRKEIFGAPIDWPKLRAEYAKRQQVGPRTLNGISFNYGNEITPRQPSALDPADRSPLALAIRAQWPDSDPTYWRMIERRYREGYKGIPEADAVKAVNAGHSIPRNAMNARAIKRRPYVGFEGDGES